MKTQPLPAPPHAAVRNVAHRTVILPSTGRVMNVTPKRLPRLWCARLGLLPFDVELPSEQQAPGSTRGPSAARAGVSRA